MINDKCQESNISKTINGLVKTWQSLRGFKTELFVWEDFVLAIKHTCVVFPLRDAPEPIRLSLRMSIWIAVGVEESVVEPEGFDTEDMRTSTPLLAKHREPWHRVQNIGAPLKMIFILRTHPWWGYQPGPFGGNHLPFSVTS